VLRPLNAKSAPTIFWQWNYHENKGFTAKKRDYYETTEPQAAVFAANLYCPQNPYGAILAGELLPKQTQFTGEKTMKMSPTVNRSQRSEPSGITD
jgi:hypothetical protein